MGSIEPAKAVVKTLQLLEALAERSDHGVTELSSRLKMHKSTVYRFLATLCELGYARQDSDDRYSPTLKIFELGSHTVQNLSIWKHAHDVMENLAQETGETIHLATEENLRLVYLHKIESTQSLRVTMMSRIGQSGPFHCTGLGKVILAHSPAERRTAILRKNPLEKFTDRTLTSVDQLMTELEKIRETGVSVDNEEHELGVRCVAVPIWVDNRRSSLAALSISAPAVRLTESKVPEYHELLQDAVRSIHENLGLHP